MSLTRPRRLPRFSALALIAVLVVGCSGNDPAAARDKVYDQARDLGQALSEATAATQDANTGFADPAFASRAIERAATESRDMADLATKVQAAPIRSIAADLVSAADHTVIALRIGDVAQAEKIRSNEFVPRASELAGLERTLPATVSDGRSSSMGSSLAAGVLAAAVIIGGVVLYLRRRAAGVATPEAPESPDLPAGGRTTPPPRASDAAGLPDDSKDPADVSQLDEPGAYRSPKVRPIDIELDVLLESALEQVKDRGWEVSLVCPTVNISGDPIRVQRAVLAALGNVHLGAPDRVGIIVEETGGQVNLSIGHDAQLDEATTEDLATRLATQLQPALATLDLNWAVAYDDEITLITVGLGASLGARESTASAM